MALSEKQQELLHAWVEGDADASECRAVKRILQRQDTREEALEYLHELRRLRALVRRDAPVPVPSSLREKVLTALREEALPRRSLRWRMVGAAAAGLVLVGLAGALGPLVLDESQTQPPIAAVTPELGNLERDGPTGVTTAAPPRQEVSEPAEVRLTLLDSSPLAACSDLMLIGNLYGEADLLKGEIFDGLEIHLHRSRLLALITALERMSVEQGYGQLVVPDALRRHLRENRETLVQLHSLAAEFRGPECDADPAGCYLPPELQRRTLGRPSVIDAAEAARRGRNEPHKVNLRIELR